MDGNKTTKPSITKDTVLLCSYRSEKTSSLSLCKVTISYIFLRQIAFSTVSKKWSFDRLSFATLLALIDNASHLAGEVSTLILSVYGEVRLRVKWLYVFLKPSRQIMLMCSWILIRNIILIDDIAIFRVFRYLLVAKIYYINLAYVCQGFNQYRRSNWGSTIIASQNAKMVIYK